MCPVSFLCIWASVTDYPLKKPFHIFVFLSFSCSLSESRVLPPTHLMTFPHHHCPCESGLVQNMWPCFNGWFIIRTEEFRAAQIFTFGAKCWTPTFVYLLRSTWETSGGIRALTLGDGGLKRQDWWASFFTFWPRRLSRGQCLCLSAGPIGQLVSSQHLCSSQLIVHLLSAIWIYLGLCPRVCLYSFPPFLSFSLINILVYGMLKSVSCPCQRALCP